MAKKVVETPLMKQYAEMKKLHPDAVLLFRVGDFYETFSEDAVRASELLGITLTRRANGAAQYVELAGFPYHALDSYLPKLIRAGQRVAICEQLEDPKTAKKLVKRGITELVTPGVVVGENVLSRGENNFVAAVHFAPAAYGVAFLDLSTGEFYTAEGSADDVAKLLVNYGPKEVLVKRGLKGRLEETFRPGAPVFELEDWIFTLDAANERLLKQFNTVTLKGFGIQQMAAAVVASGALLHYLDITCHTQTSHITSLARIEEEKYVRLDRFTVRNLELVSPLSDDGHSLLSVLDRTSSPMGARLLRRWIVFPLKDPAEINRRLDVVEHFFRVPEARATAREALERIGDIERLIGRAAVGRVTPREVMQLRHALEALVPLKKVCEESGQESLADIGRQMNTCGDLRRTIARTLVDTPPAKLGSGQPTVRPGYNDELDQLRDIAHSGRDYLLKIQQRESQRTGIPSLKIGFNNVFGYYIEVTNTHKDKVPDDWIRRQTLVNGERYITPELKTYEEKILKASEQIDILEERIFRELVERVTSFVPVITLNARLVATLDCLMSFTRVSLDNRYNRPVVDDSLELQLTEARHPVIERQLPPDEPYIANSVHLSNQGTQVMMITGPNMAGKSALLRQTALNVLMAQIGCFVAADAARIGVVDKIFTRVGASDNISSGESTFMVEMTEAASILNNMSERSLILFDELGRGTSTYDGISLAWAIVEHIHEHPTHPKTMFATHYHELNEMEASFTRILNYNVTVQEVDGKVVFLRKIAPGGSEHSFGIHVARLAGMPPAIVRRADTVLQRLEEGAAERGTPAKELAQATSYDTGMQLSFFQLDDPVLSQIRDEILGLDINNLTPMEALNKLHGIKSILTGRPS